MRPKPPQPCRYLVSSLVKAAKPNLEPRLSQRSNGPSPGGRGRGDRPRGSFSYRKGRGGPRPGRTRWPGRLVPRLNRSLRALLRRLRRPPRLPGRVQRHLPHLAHPVLGDAGDHQRLVDPRLELVQRRHGAAGYDPVLGAVALRSLDTEEFRVAGGGKLVL